jgi:DNA-binding transcriptional LysR family regulator
MVLACSPRHALAQAPYAQLRDLEGQKYIHFDKNLTIRKHVDRFLRDQGISVHVVHEFDNIENIKQAVVVGAGVALLPEPTLRREVKARTLVAVPLFGSRMTRPLGIIHRRRHKLSRGAMRFIELLREDVAGKPEANGAVHPPAASARRNGPGRAKRN